MANNDSLETINSDLAQLNGEPFWRGSVDLFDGVTVSGWAISIEKFWSPTEIEVFLFGIKVQTAVCNLIREDIISLVRFPLKAGFSVDIRKVPIGAAQGVLKRVRDFNGATAKVGDIVEVRINGTKMVLPFGRDLAESEIELAVIARAISPFASQIEGGQGEVIRLRNNLLSAPLGGDSPDVKIVAYYLPQFHPFVENNDWWGTGFTEWTNVTCAKPLYEGHYQPHLPADLGFYDLRLDQVHIEQISLAKKYGLSGFCYYYYWFSGQTLMTMPIDRHLEQNLDFDFCLCWANESWSRRWDGSENDVLMAQQHTFESDVDFIRSCLKYFHSDRYIKIAGAPYLQVYRVSLMESPLETFARWREIVRDAGFPDLHISMVESFGLSNPHEFGCDSSCQFPPHGVVGEKINDEIRGLVPSYSGTVYSYAEIVRGEIARPTVTHTRFRAAMPSWDNTSRKGDAGNVFHGASPELFATWIRHLVNEAQIRLPKDQRFVFVNAWNEWAEGTHLEPDRRFGHANLRAIRDALMPDSLALAPLISAEETDSGSLAETRRYVESLINVNRALTQLVSQTKFGWRTGEEAGFALASTEVLDVHPIVGAAFNIDSVNGRAVERPVLLPLGTWQGLNLRGWSILLERNASPTLIALRNTARAGGGRYVAAIHQREDRHDVLHALSLEESMLKCGFWFKGSLHGIPSGRYEVEFLWPDGENARSAVAASTALYLMIG